MGLKYAAFHWFIHFFLVFLLANFLNADFYSLLLIFFSSVFIDLDHLPILLKKGIRGIITFEKPRKYLFHNFFFLVFFASLSILPIYFLLRLVFFSLFLHLIWDLVEDVLIFRLGTKHWFFKKNK
ncbi:MAG: hypothetical protein QXQ69_01410 [Candidatus Aenigmatarchaeota archaeon]